MPWLSTDISVFDYSAKLYFNTLKPEIALGLLTSDEIKIQYGGAGLLNDGADGFYIGSRVGVDVGKIKITPSFLFAKIKFGNGDFYEFYGKPDLSGLTHFGLSAEYDKTHTAGVAYENFDLDILNNNALTLFQSDNYSVGMNYRYVRRAQRGPWEFYVTSGFNYAEIIVDGALTAANQQYFLFPYAFYNVSGTAAAFAGWTMLSLDIHGRCIEHRIKAGAGNVFGGNVYANARFRYRKFYGNEETSEDIVKIDPAGTGIAFSVYSLESRGLAVADRVHVYWGLRKITCYYWGMDKFDTVGGKEPVYGEADLGGLVRTVLLSGLSGSLRIAF